MYSKNINDFLEKSIKFKPKEIDSKVRCWMIRTKRGYFYEEFVRDKFIALGWNIITETTNLSEQSLDVVKESVRELYGDKVPMTAINKCKNFINLKKQHGEVVSYTISFLISKTTNNRKGSLYSCLISAELIQGNPEGICEFEKSGNPSIVPAFEILDGTDRDAGKFGQFWDG